MTSSRSLLVVLAHPDDETFPMGGTLARLADRGWSVYVLTATNGEAGRRGPFARENLSSSGFAAIRRRELEDACRILGARPLPSLRCPDGGVAACGHAARRHIERQLRHIAPRVVITFGPDGISGHKDHVAIGRFTRDAWEDLNARGTGLRRQELLYVLGSEGLPDCCLAGPNGHEPPESLRVDVTSVFDRKLAAMAAHASQAHLQPADAARRDAIRQAPERFHRVVSSAHAS